MTWRYEQRAHRLTHDGELITDEGYSGLGPDRDDPASQNKPFLGPIPQGTYTIGQPVANGGHMGPFVLPLTPSPANNMFGREGFFIHGDKIGGPAFTASNGCIILNRPWRTLIAQSGDNVLVVDS